MAQQIGINRQEIDLPRPGRYAQNPGATAASMALRPDLAAITRLIRPGSRVFDVGCGDGALLAYLKAEHGVIGRGLELSEAGVLACVRRGLSVRQGDLEHSLADYPDRAFDTVVLSQTLPFVDDPTTTLCELVRVGARAIVSFANWGYWRCRMGLLLRGHLTAGPDLPRPWYASPRARPLSVRDFGDFCAAHGLTVVGAHYLAGSRPLQVSWGSNWRATTAIFELAGKS